MDYLEATQFSNFQFHSPIRTIRAIRCFRLLTRSRSVRGPSVHSKFFNIGNNAAIHWSAIFFAPEAFGWT